MQSVIKYMLIQLLRGTIGVIVFLFSTGIAHVILFFSLIKRK